MESVSVSSCLVRLCLIFQRKSKVELLVCPAESSLAFAFLLVQLWPNFISGVKLLESPRLPLPPSSRSLHSVQVVLTSLLLFLSRSDGLTAGLGPNSPNRSGIWLVSWKDQCLVSLELGPSHHCGAVRRSNCAQSKLSQASSVCALRICMGVTAWKYVLTPSPVWHDERRGPVRSVHSSSSG